jgi:hypothetical protein
MTTDIKPRIVDGEPVCCGGECPADNSDGDCGESGELGKFIMPGDPCIPALRAQRDDTRKALAWCLEGFEGTYNAGFFESPLYKKIQALLGEELIRRIQADAAREED